MRRPTASEMAAASGVAAVTFLPFVRGLGRGHSLYFRDLADQFFPVRLFLAEGLARGELRYWNPYLYEGSPAGQPPLGYPLELLQVFLRSEWGLSLWLCLHVPLAAVCMLVLARGLGLSLPASAMAGIAYGLGGFVLGTVNFYVYTPAMAWAPLAILALSRAAEQLRHVLLAAVLLAVCLSTLAAEVALQAAALGAALALRQRTAWRPAALGRLALAGLLSVGLSAPFLIFVRGISPESERAAGFAPFVVLGHSVHPVTLAQTAIANFHGELDDIANAWWGMKFFPYGFPYALSLYLGAPLLVLAAAGLAHPRFPRLTLALAAALALWVCLGPWGGWHLVISYLPAVFRFPVKAFFTVHLSIALLAAAGLDVLHTARPRVGARVAGAFLAGGLLLAATPLLPRLAPTTTARLADAWLPAGWPMDERLDRLRRVFADARLGGALALAAGTVALAAAGRRLEAGKARGLLTGVIAADLLRTGAGLNPMVSPSFYELSPETAALAARLRDGEARLFTCTVELSPAYWAARRARPGGHEVWTFLASAETLMPYTNLGPRVATAYGIDRTMLVPMSRTLARDEAACRPGPPDVRRLRLAGVTHVSSLHPLEHPDLQLLELTRPARISPLAVHLYALARPMPRAQVARHVQEAATREAAEARILSDPAFAGDGGVFVEGPVAGLARAEGEVQERKRSRAGRIELAVTASAETVVVVREGFADGWTARVGESPAEVWRANGRHLAVRVPRGDSRVVLEYRPPRMAVGWSIAAVSAAIVLGLAWRRA